MQNAWQKKKVILTVTDSCLDFLTKEGDSKEFGARNVARTVEDKIADQLVDEVLFGKLEKGGQCQVDYSSEEDKLIFNIN